MTCFSSYHFYRIVHNTLIVLTVRDLLLELFKPPPRVEKWQFCLQAVKGGFGEILSSMYLQQFSKLQLDNYKIKVHTFALNF